MCKKLISIMFLVAATFITSIAYSEMVPKYFNYQAVLFDEAGNLLPDGKTRLDIRILDSSMNVIFEEQQETEVVSGVVSLMIGNGVSVEDAVPVDGVNIDILTPDGPKYLEIQAEGYPAEEIMEIVSVPYSTYADVALTVVDQSIGAKQIKNGAITMGHFADGLLSEISEEILSGGKASVVMRDEFTNFTGDLSGSSGAKKIGVTSDFANSSANNLQDVLADFDLSIKKRGEDAKKVDENNLSLDGGDAMTGNLNMGSNKISGLLSPEEDTDAVTKKFVDDGMSNMDSKVTSHTSDKSNPHSVTTAQIGAATKTELNAHAQSTNNPHIVTTTQIGAATKSELISHTQNKENPHTVTTSQIGAAPASHLADKSNPHTVTPGQIGAVSNDDLYSNGKIKDEKIPDNILRITPNLGLPIIGSGGITQPNTLWKIDPDVNALGTVECSLNQNDWTVTCILDKQDVTQFSNVLKTCNFNYEVVPKFAVYASGGVDIKMTTTTHLGSGWGGAYCGLIVKIELGNLGWAPAGSSMKWVFYKRQIGL